MKRKIAAILLAAVFTLTFAMGCFADDYEYDTLANWNIKVAIPDNTQAVLDSDGNFYIYPQEYGVIPYVMLRVYEGFEDPDDFAYNYFIDGMADVYSDLELVLEPKEISLDGIIYTAFEFNYTVQGYQVIDCRLVKTVNGKTYMFGSKEIPELDKTIDDLLLEVAYSSKYLDENGEVIDFGPVDERRDDGSSLWWEDIEEEVTAEGFKGTFMTLDEVGYEIWIPDDILFPNEVPQGQEGADTFIAFYTTPEMDAYAAAMFVPVGITLDEYKDMLGSVDGVYNITDYMINGEPFIVYFMNDGEVMCMSTIVEGKGLLEFSFSPLTNVDFAEYIDIMGVSIRPVK